MRLALVLVWTVGCGQAHVHSLDITRSDDWALPASTEGAVHGFRSATAGSDVLWSSEAEATGDLAVDNTSGAWADVAVNGVAVGRLEPFAVGVLHGVPAGSYEVALTLPGGFVKRQVVEVPADGSNAVTPMAPPRLPGG